MIVKRFNPKEGQYAFEFDDIATSCHSHPAVEMLWTKQGSLQVSTEQCTFKDISFAIIAANVSHEVVAHDCQVEVVMLERRDQAIRQSLSEQGLSMENGLFVHRKGVSDLVDFGALMTSLSALPFDTGLDARVRQVLDYLDNNELSYEGLLETLIDQVHLSKSRLSHLFRSNIGLSLKKYLLWCRLRNTIAEHLDKDEDLFASLINSGFYDHPHFSKAFRTMLGVKPSHAYNSRTVQL